MTVKILVPTLSITMLAMAFAACEKAERPPAAKTTQAPVAAATSNSAPAAASPVTAPSNIAPALLAPEQATAKAPDTFKVKFETTKGDFVVEVHRDWSPLAADRFYNLVKIGFYNDVAFFRAISGFMIQLGIHGEPAVNAKWQTATIADDPMHGQSNKRGYLSYAKGGPNSRTTQFFINLVDNARLDPMGFSPFGQITSGMDVVDKLYMGYGEGAPSGRGPNQMRIQSEGNKYLHSDYPELDYVKKASLQG